MLGLGAGYWFARGGCVGGDELGDVLLEEGCAVEHGSGSVLSTTVEKGASSDGRKGGHPITMEG